LVKEEVSNFKFHNITTLHVSTPVQDISVVKITLIILTYKEF